MDDEVGLGLRERKKRATRTALADAAFELSVQHGPDAVTVESIAAAADVSPRTFFNYFDSKEQAILARNAERWLRTPRLLAAQDDAMAPWDALTEALVGIYEGADQQRTLRETLALVDANPALLSQQRDDYAVGEQLLVDEVARRTGTTPDDLHPRLVVAVAVAAVRVAVRRWLDDGGDADVEEQIRRALALVAAGLPTPATTSA